MLEHDRRRARAMPTSYVMLVMGDFNLLPKGELPHYIDHLEGASRQGRPFRAPLSSVRLPQSGRQLDGSDEEMSEAEVS
eukprot:8057633-Karenia_brevis.AAC.1